MAATTTEALAGEVTEEDTDRGGDAGDGGAEDAGADKGVGSRSPLSTSSSLLGQKSSSLQGRLQASAAL